MLRSLSMWSVLQWPCGLMTSARALEEQRTELCSSTIRPCAPAMCPALPNWTKDKANPSKELPLQLGIDRKTQKQWIRGYKNHSVCRPLLVYPVVAERGQRMSSCSETPPQKMGSLFMPHTDAQTSSLAMARCQSLP